ncbi:lysostaphin resistance A-like protein [Anaerocolumna jejuensis]|uniref:CPBP family intramembrane glutamic endopeptidase n=1 Tax=Anaerocolumna jejuensis TaxID=259063 RepID=UPI003F7C6A47
MKRPGDYLATVLPLLLAFVIQILGAAWIGIIYSLVKVYHTASQGGIDINNLQRNLAEDIQDPQFLLVISAIFGVIDIIVFGIWLRNIKRKEVLDRKPSSLSAKNVVIIIALGMCLQIGLSIMLTLISSLQPGWFEKYGDLMDKLGMGNSLASFLYVGIIGPIAEELIFRGVTFHKARKVLPFFAANILQALLFGIYHMNIIQGLYAFAIGLCFGLVRYVFHTLAASIALHMSVNLSGILLSYALTDKLLLSPVSGGILFVVSAAGIVCSLIYFIRLSRNAEEENTLYTYDEN